MIPSAGGNVSTIGAQAFFNTTQFNQGLAQYVNGLNQATKTTQTTAQTTTATGKGLSSSLGGLFGGAGKTVSGLISSIGGLSLGAAAGLGILAGGFVALGKEIMDAVGKIKEFIAAGIEMASKEEEIYYMSVFMATGIGMSKKAVDEQIAAMEKLGVTDETAMAIIRDFSRYGLDTSQMEKFTTAALDLAAATGESTGQVAADLLEGIKRGRSRSLMQVGVILDQKQVYAEYAASLGKAAAALTTTEKSQAMLNATLKAAEGVAGANAVSLETLERKQRGLKMATGELAESFGYAFLPMKKNLTDMKRGFIDSFRAATAEGQPLGDFLSRLAAYGSVATEGLVGFGKKAGAAIADFIGRGAEKFEEFVFNALTWGINVSTQFAIGLVEGATSAITWALDMISGLIGGMLAPGSPPKALPDLPKWGAAAMTEYMKGFAEADFSALEGIQRPLENALSILEQTGKIQDAGKIMAKLSKEIAKVLDTGLGEESVLAKIQKAAGPFGVEIADLAKKQFALARATKAAEEAEKALKAAEERTIASRAKLNKSILQYNAMLKSGASKEALAAKLDEINATREEVTAAEEQQQQAEKNQEQANANIDTLKEQVSLQEKLIQQLTDLTRKQIKMPEIAGGRGAGGGGEGKDPLEEAWDKIKQNMTAKLDELKAKIREKLGELFAPISEAWEKHIKPAFEKLKAKWDEVTAPIKEWWQRDVQPGIDRGIQWLKDQWTGAVNFLTGWWRKYGLDILTVIAATYLKIKITLGRIAVAVKGALQSFFQFGARIWGWLGEQWNKLNERFKITDRIKQGLAGAWTWLKNTIKTIFTDIGDFFATWAEGIRNGQYWEGLKNAFSELWNKIKERAAESWSNIVETVGGFIESAKTRVQEKFEEIREAISTWITARITDISTRASEWGEAAKAWIQDVKDKVEAKFIEVKDAIAGWITDRVKEITDRASEWGTAAQGWINNILGKFGTNIEALKTAILNWISPAVDFVKKGVELLKKLALIGKGIIDGIIQGIKDNASTFFNYLTQLALDALDTILKALHIRSPSEDFAYVGEMMIAGLIQGVTETGDSLNNTMAATAESAVGALGAGVSEAEKQLAGLKGMMNSLPLTTELGIAVNIMTNGKIPNMTGATVPLDYSMNNGYSTQLTTLGTQRPPTTGYGVAGMNSSRIVTINFGDISISNGMDLSLFEARVRSLVQNELTT